MVLPLVLLFFVSSNNPSSAQKQQKYDRVVEDVVISYLEMVFMQLWPIVIVHCILHELEISFNTD